VHMLAQHALALAPGAIADHGSSWTPFGHVHSLRRFKSVSDAARLCELATACKRYGKLKHGVAKPCVGRAQSRR
jgi:hypothetical protein